MFGLSPGFGVLRVVLIEGAEGRENRALEAAGERCSADEREEAERTEKRGCGCAKDMMVSGKSKNS